MIDKPYKFCIRRSVTCAQSVNDKIRWTSHSSFVHCTHLQMASYVRGEVDEVREERPDLLSCQKHSCLLPFSHGSTTWHFYNPRNTKRNATTIHSCSISVIALSACSASRQLLSQARPPDV